MSTDIEKAKIIARDGNCDAITRCVDCPISDQCSDAISNGKYKVDGIYKQMAIEFLEMESNEKAKGTEIPMKLAISIVETTPLESRYTDSDKVQLFAAQVGYVVLHTCLNTATTVASFHETQARARAHFERS
jgi:hypothetical protein